MRRIIPPWTAQKYELEPTEPFHCSSLEDLTPVNAQMNQLKTSVNKIADKSLKSKLNTFYNTIYTFSSMMSTLKPVLKENQKCCKLYRTSQKNFLNTFESAREKLKKAAKIQPFESKLLSQFINVSNATLRFNQTYNSYSAEISDVVAKINQINSSPLKEKPKHITELNSIIDNFVLDSCPKVINNIQADVTKIADAKCPDIKGFYGGL